MAKPSKRISTWGIDRSNLERHIRPLLGSVLIGDLTKSDAARAFWDIRNGKMRTDERTGPRGRARVTGGEGTARRTRSTAAAMFSWAVEHELASSNPFAGLRLTVAPLRQRFLSLAESRRFLTTIQCLEADGSLASEFADALRLLLLTGARKSEILGLRWSEVVSDHALLVLPQERTKAGGRNGERHIVLSPEALDLLQRRRARAPAAASLVFPSSRGHGPIVGIRRPFLKVCAAAELEGLRVHDLRHSFASLAVSNGAPLFIVGKLLGHANTRTTERYAHLSDGPLRAVAAEVGRRLTQAQAQA